MIINRKKVFKLISKIIIVIFTIIILIMGLTYVYNLFPKKLTKITLKQGVKNNWNFFIDDNNKWHWIYVDKNDKIINSSKVGFSEKLSCIQDAIKNGYDKH